MRRKRGAIYVARWADDSPVKIGFTSKPIPERLKTLQSLMPYRLYLVSARVGDTGDERRLHQRFAGQRMLSEWFEPCPEIDAYISANPVPEDVAAFDHARFRIDDLEVVRSLDQGGLFLQAAKSLSAESPANDWRWLDLHSYWPRLSYMPTAEEAETIINRMRAIARRQRKAA